MAPAATLTESGRAIAIRVSSAKGIVDVAPADRWVDVIFTHTPGESPKVSEILVENVRVLTLEPLVANGGNGDQSAAHAVTLDVDIETAQNLLLASQVGDTVRRFS